MASINRYSLFLLRERKNLLRLSLNENNNQIAAYYCDEKGNCDDRSNPNGALKNIAGILNKEKTLIIASSMNIWLTKSYWKYAVRR